MRQFNERVVLQAIRLHGALPGAEIARADAADRADHLADHQAPARRRPAAARRTGARQGRPALGAAGAEPRRRLLDRHQDRPPQPGHAAGRLHRRRRASAGRWTTRFADPDRCSPRSTLRLGEVRRKLGRRQRERLQGIGIAAPLSLGGWQTLLGVDRRSIAEKWRASTCAREVARRTELPVEFVKDTAAACVAELVAGRGRSMSSFLYVFVDTFIGGGLVLDSHLRGGSSGNAGAIGSLPLWPAAQAGRRGAPRRNCSAWPRCSTWSAIRAAGLDAGAVTDARALQEPWLPTTQAWLARSRPGHRAGRQRVGLPARPRRRDRRRLVQPRAARRPAGRRRARARPLQLGRRGAARSCWPAPSARTRAPSAARCCRCMPTSRPTATCS